MINDGQGFITSTTGSCDEYCYSYDEAAVVTLSPTPKPSSPCEGNTPDWVDNYGSGCEWYERVDQPGCPTYGNLFSGDMGPASENCCYCMMTLSPATTSAPTWRKICFSTLDVLALRHQAI